MAQANFADLIYNHIEDLTAAWIDSVRADARIQSDDDLSEDGLRDHIPAVIEEVCWLLRSGESPTLLNTREARVHAYVRFRQGYRGRELVRELSLLRMALLDHISAGLLDESYVEATRLINLYIDEELSYAVSVYAEGKKESKESSSEA